MLMLQKSAFEKAKNHVLKHGIPIETAWFRYNFENEDTDEFMKILAQYQHDNGGFGGLSHEFAYQGPCLQCTKYAFDYIFNLSVKPKSSHPVIQNMMKYVLARYRTELGSWGDLLEPEVNDFIHVRWEEYEGNDENYDNYEERLKHYSHNRHAALAALIALYSELVPKKLYDDIIKYPIEKVLLYYDEKSHLKGTFTVDNSIKDEIESPYNMKCLQQFCDCLKDEKISNKLKGILSQNPTACMELDDSKWNKGYHETACDVVTRSDSFLYSIVKDEVDKSLDALINRQSDDGIWHLSWRFGESKELKSLQLAYEVYATMFNLVLLKRYKRIKN